MPTTTHTNKLINEKSPYLLQHAHNPVDWFPWGDEAFAKAKTEDKPVFLSIGYSTCHWCHVMERESFEDEGVAEIINKSFVCIKVDREERPDVDNFYMSACMALNSSGGWPLSCFLTPDRKPFFAGTYFPKEDAYSMPGFKTVLNHIAGLWKNNRNELLEASQSILKHLSEQSASKQTKLKNNIENTAFKSLINSYDEHYGGFSPAPKFPSLQNLLFLIRYNIAVNDRTALEMIDKTLRCMYQGGIYDHIGGGFCRYSTDEAWLVPHFEKMLYDNAMHILTYAEAGVLINNDFAEISREISAFCIRELRDDSGGFYTAIDADSEGVEGKFYVFSPLEIKEALCETDGKRYCELFDITAQGNFEGKNIPNLISRPLTATEKTFARTANERLLTYRAKRIPPFLDDKILTANNALMIAALAAQGRLLIDTSFIEYAEQCADFLLDKLVVSGRLMSSWRDGSASSPATSDDYAYLIWGLIELYESTFSPKWLRHALNFTQNMMEFFWDKDGGGFYLSGSDITDLPLRQKNTHDGAIPSGNSVAAQNLLRLARLCDNSDYERMANDIFGLVASSLNSYPSAYCGLLSALLYLKNGGTEIILVNGDGIDELKNISAAFSPFTVVAVCGSGYEEMAELAPFLSEYAPLNGKATAYVCSGGSCHQPINEPESLKKLIEKDRATHL